MEPTNRSSQSESGFRPNRTWTFSDSWCLPYSNLSKEEWQTIKSLTEDKSIVIKKADKGPCAVVWDKLDYLSEAEKQLGDKIIYKDV